VVSPRPKDDGPREPTLGELLFADEPKAPTSEREWVDLVRSMATGDQQALHALYERTHRIVFTLMVRMTSSRETAEELTLDVFHDVWRRAATYDNAGGSVLGWIMNQARSRAIDRLRFEQRKKRVDPSPDTPPPAPSTGDPQEAFDVREQGRRLKGALEVLTPDERQAIEVAFFSGHTYAEVAARLGHPVGTVKTRVRSGLGKLRHALSTKGRGE
jgi:RNA polymerase sigma-70 factor (ECF subfamily)